MSELGGFESFSPDEGGGKVSEGLSEQAKERFQAAQVAIRKLRQEEGKAKKRDDHVAQAIIRFLDDERYTHLFLLVSRLVARDCPSIFILSILSLIDDNAEKVVHDFIAEQGLQPDDTQHAPIAQSEGAMTEEAQHAMLQWVSRMHIVMSIDGKNILVKLLVDEGNIDGTVLQLTTFVMKEFFAQHAQIMPFEELQPLTAHILQTIFEPFLHHVDDHLIETARQEEGAGNA